MLISFSCIFLGEASVQVFAHVSLDKIFIELFIYSGYKSVIRYINVNIFPSI